MSRSGSRLCSILVCTALLVPTGVLIGACDSSAPAEVKTWEAVGDDKSSAKIAHEEIEGFMR